ncbi:unnamed protein product [Xylocopa violacea]|uniref:C2H2-type domain-containing protein n=1 Tax=Xylocopa violacea TaxID=135666 RepID=A0ABP1NK14_XYLVO
MLPNVLQNKGMMFQHQIELPLICPGHHDSHFYRIAFIACHCLSLLNRITFDDVPRRGGGGYDRKLARGRRRAVCFLRVATYVDERLEATASRDAGQFKGWQPAAAVGQGGVANCVFYRCDVCGKSYSWKSSYHRHLREECGNQQRAAPKCNNCGRQYRWRDSLNKHLKYECGVEPKYTCSVCGRKFRHKQLLTSHLKRFH